MAKRKGYNPVLGTGQVRYERTASSIVDYLFQEHDIEHRDLLDFIIDKILGREEPMQEVIEVQGKYYAKTKTKDKRNKLDELIDNILHIPGPLDPSPEQTDNINLLQGNDETFKNI